MRLAAVSLFGLAVGLFWTTSILGERDRADCGWLRHLLYESAAVGMAILAASICGLIGAVIVGLVQWARGSSKTTQRPRAAWPPALAATSLCLIAALVLALVSGGDWWAIAAVVGVAAGGAVFAFCRSRAQQRH